MRQAQIQNIQNEIGLVITVARKILGDINIKKIEKLDYESMVKSIMFSLRSGVSEGIKETEIGYKIYYSDHPGDEQITIITDFELDYSNYLYYDYTVFLYYNYMWCDVILYNYNGDILIGYRLYVD